MRRDKFVMLKKICAVMSSFTEQEYACQQNFKNAGQWYHACTPENFPVFMTTEEDYKLAISLLGLVALACPDINIVAFEFMNNHIHLIVVGDKGRTEMMLNDYVSALHKQSSSFSVGESMADLHFRLHHIDDLKYARNAIAYVHRNRFLVDSSVTPFTFRWGSNMLYFNQLVVNCIQASQSPTTQKWRRNVSRRHIYDSMECAKQFDGHVSFLCFCNYALGESLFRSARHYYETIAKSVEGMAQIAGIIGESVSLTDDEIYKVMLYIARRDYSSDKIAELAINDRLDIARKLRYGYNANNKQICRMLKLEQHIVDSLLGI